jgi:hypothetical protein
MRAQVGTSRVNLVAPAPRLTFIGEYLRDDNATKGPRHRNS